MVITGSDMVKTYRFDTDRVKLTPKSMFYGRVLAKMTDAVLDEALANSVQGLWPLPLDGNSRHATLILLAEKARRGRGEPVEKWHLEKRRDSEG
jgi:hypothetical protein